MTRSCRVRMGKLNGRGENTDVVVTREITAVETHLATSLDNLGSHLGLTPNSYSLIFWQLFQQFGLTKRLGKMINLVPLIPQILRSILRDVFQQQDFDIAVFLAVLFCYTAACGECRRQESGKLTDDGGWCGVLREGRCCSTRGSGSGDC